MPVLNDATKTENTLTNDGYYRMTETEEETTIVWDTANAPKVFTVNGVDIDLTSLDAYHNTSFSIAFADDVVIRYLAAGVVSNVQVWKGNTVASLGVDSGKTLTLTLTSSGITWGVTGASDQAINHSGKYFVLDTDGEYIMKYATGSAYLLEDSSIFYAGGISNAGSWMGVYIEGTADDYETTVLGSGVTISNKASEYSDVSGYIGLISLNKLTMTASYTSNDTPTETTWTYSYFLVPYQVTAELSAHLTPGQIALMGAIPVLVIVALLVVAVGVVARRND